MFYFFLLFLVSFFGCIVCIVFPFSGFSSFVAFRPFILDRGFPFFEGASSLLSDFFLLKFC